MIFHRLLNSTEVTKIIQIKPSGLSISQLNNLTIMLTIVILKMAAKEKYPKKNDVFRMVDEKYISQHTKSIETIR